MKNTPVLLAFALFGATSGALAQQLPRAGAEPKANAPAQHVPLRTLEDMKEKARADLAMRLGGTLSEVTVARWAPVRLPLRVLRCEVPKGDEGEVAVPGYRIILTYKGRDYSYQSDLQSVAPCPKIEAN
jgi:hypothetical protein